MLGGGSVLDVGCAAGCVVGKGGGSEGCVKVGHGSNCEGLAIKEVVVCGVSPLDLLSEMNGKFSS